MMGLSPSKAKACDASTAYFFALPRELRDQVYHHLWTSTLLAFRHDTIVTVARYSTESEYTILDALPAWLAANHQVCDEGMQQLYRHAHFTVGEHYSLPLYLYRDSLHGPVIASPRSTRPDDHHDYETLTIEEIASDLLSLKYAHKLVVKDLCSKFEAYYLSRDGCLSSSTRATRNYCSTGCCTLHVDVSIAPGDGEASPAFFSNFHIIQHLLENESIALQELQLEISSGGLRLRNNRPPGDFSRYIRQEGRNVKASIHYNWSLLERLPKTLRKVNLGLIDDWNTPRKEPEICILPLQIIRKKCEDVVAGMVELQNENQDQKVNVKSWSYLRKGLNSWCYRQPTSRKELPASTVNDYLCSHWEATSPKVERIVETEGLSSLIETYNVGDSVICEVQESRNVVWRRTSM
jgi:hypothetical protein